MENREAMDKVFKMGLKAIYFAEKETFDNLQLLSDTASSSELKSLFQKHRGETQKQIQRLEKIGEMLDVDYEKAEEAHHGLHGVVEKGKEILKSMVEKKGKDRSSLMGGIINEGKEMLENFKDAPDIKELLIVAAGEKVEDFEVSSYKSLCFLAECLGEKDVLHMLRTTLDEEERMEKKLTEFADANLKPALENQLAKAS